MTGSPARRALRASAMSLAAAASFAAMLGGSPASAATAAASSAGLTAVPPSVDSAHRYRHGRVPVLAAGDAVHLPAVAHARHGAGGALTASAGDLRYQGGVTGSGYSSPVGVTTGAPKVYLVFWGSQWGAQGTNVQGDTTLLGDANGEAPRLQEFFKGLGTGGETWSGVMTQYCEGVTAATVFCPSGSAQVGYPTGGALAGVYVDEGAAAPTQATAHQLGQEAVNAAGHFGNTSAAANRNVQYFIVSPSGTHPDGFNTRAGNFCAWHDFTGDTTMSGGAVASPDGDVAFTNMPYVTDMAGNCGENFVNAGTAGVLDGATIVGGHEYAETITDQFPAGGWIDTSGAENGDKCAWIASGQGASQDYAFTTGSFAVQSTWANDFNGGAGGCEVSHAIVSSAPDFGLSASPASQSVIQGASASYTIGVTPTGGYSGQVNLSVSGLPAGAAASFSTNPTSSGSTLSVTTSSSTPTGSYPLTITGTDTGGSPSHTTTATLVVNPPPTPDYGLGVSPSSQTVTQGSGTSYAVSVTPANGFSSSVDLSVSGLPSGATGSFNPTPTASTSTLTVSTATTTPAGTYTLTISGSGGGIAHTTTATLVVRAPAPDFTLSSNPTSRSVARGAATTYGLTIGRVNGFSSSVALTVSGLPSRATASFSVNPATSSSTLTVSANRRTPVGTYHLTIKGAGGGLSHSITVTLVVT